MATRKTRVIKGPESQLDDLPEGLDLVLPKYVTAGRSGLRVSAGLIDEEFLRDLQGKDADRIYREMADNSPVIGGALFLMEMLIGQVEWRFETADKSTSRELVDFYDSLLEDMEDPFSLFVSETREVAVHGFLPVEILYKVRRGYNPDFPILNSRHDDGMIGWRNLATRSPDSRHEWIFDHENNPVALVQQVETDPVTRVIPADKMVILRLRSRKHSPEGMSMLRHAYLPYFLWKKLQEIEAIGIERNVAGYPVFEAPPEAFHQSSPNHHMLQQFADLNKGIRQHDVMGLVIPAAETEQGKTGWKFSLISASGANKAETDPIIQRYRSDQALALLSQFMLLGQQATGSWSLSSDQSSTLAMALGTWLDMIATTLQRGPIPQLARMNAVPKTESLPRLVHTDIEKKDIATFIDSFNKLVTTGTLTVTDADEEHMRTMLELPTREDGKPKPPAAPPSEEPPQQPGLFDET